jgi:hypothetical protein
MPNDFGIPATDHNLLEDLATASGYSDPMDMLEDSVHDSVVPGICITCKGTQDSEPDARANWCEECGTNTVRSCLDIAGTI